MRNECRDNLISLAAGCLAFLRALERTCLTVLATSRQLHPSIALNRVGHVLRAFAVVRPLIRRAAVISPLM